MAEDTATTAAAAAPAATAASTGAASTTATTGAAAATTTTTPAAAPADKGAATTVLSDGKGAAADTTAATDKAGTWAADWRLKMAKGDADLAKRFERYASPEAVAEALVAAQTRISKGEVTKVLGANPTEAELKEYRTANGIPEKPEDYKLEPGEGRVIGDEDKPIIDKIVKNFHGKHATPAQVNDAVKLYFDLQDEQIAQRHQQDREQSEATNDALREEYGPEFKANRNAVRGLIDTFPEDVREALLNARAPDGTALFNIPGFMRRMVALSRELNPAATIVPGAAGNAVNVIGDEIAKYKGMMADGTWDTHPERDKFKKRYEELITAQGRLKAA